MFFVGNVCSEKPTWEDIINSIRNDKKSEASGTKLAEKIYNKCKVETTIETIKQQRLLSEQEENFFSKIIKLLDQFFSRLHTIETNPNMEKIQQKPSLDSKESLKKLRDCVKETFEERVNVSTNLDTAGLAVVVGYYYNLIAIEEEERSRKN
jgi:DNA replication initiation complex subunit (GINS family)